MSFILEALKKSENERQRKIGPSLADVQVRARPDEKPWWAFAVGALLLVNLTVLLVVLLRDEDPPVAPAQSLEVNESPRVAPATNSVITTPPPARRAPLQMERQPAEMAAVTADPSVRSLADEATVDGDPTSYPPENPNLAIAAEVPERSAIVRPIQAPTVAPSDRRAQVQTTQPEPEEVLPTYRELGGTSGNLPDLHLDIHVHSPNAAERFVFVNMRKYIEGQALSEGPVVERITADGVVLDHRGLRFLLPRQ